MTERVHPFPLDYAQAPQGVLPTVPHNPIGRRPAQTARYSELNPQEKRASIEV